MLPKIPARQAGGGGLATAQTFLAAGAKVALADIDGNNVRRAAEGLSERAIGVQADVAAEEQVTAMIAETEARLGPVDIFVSSAAILDDKQFLDSAPADWRKMIDICLYGPMFRLHQLLAGMMARGYGRVVCIASDAARVGQARHSSTGWPTLRPARHLRSWPGSPSRAGESSATFLN